MGEKKLVVLGSVNADHILLVDDFPKPGETVTGHGYRVVPGGKGANQAVAAARLGADISFIACVGDDDFGTRMISEFKADGINTDAVMQVENTPTGIAIIYVSSSGENSIGISAEANAELTPERLLPHEHCLAKAKAVLMQLESPIETVERAAQMAAEAGVRVILNPAPAQPLSDALLKNISMITPNETEAEFLTGITVTDRKSAGLAAAKLHEKGIETVLITLGADGVFVSENGSGHIVPGFAVDATDTTAAGDTFNGALVTAMLEGKDMNEAIRFAHAAAAISVTRLGAQTSIPTRDETDEFLKQQDR